MRSSNDIASEIGARKIEAVAFGVGFGTPLGGAVIASYAATDSTASGGSSAILAFLILAGCAFGPTLLVRAVASRSVLPSIVLAQAMMLGLLSLAAFGLSNDEMSQTIVVLAAVWVTSLGGSVSGHALGAAIAARRAERSIGGAQQAKVTDVEQQAIVELEYLTSGWQIAQITRSHQATGEYDLVIELESQILERHGYRRIVIDRQESPQPSLLVSLALGSADEPDTVRVTYSRTATETGAMAPAIPKAERMSEWEKHR